MHDLVLNKQTLNRIRSGWPKNTTYSTCSHFAAVTFMWSSFTWRTSPRLGVIFDTISVKARWEQWCRWNCDLRVINARKKSFSVVPKASPRRPNHVTICLLRHSGESLQNGQLELRRRNWYFARETHKLYQFEPARQDFERVPVFHGFCEIALTEVLATQMGVMQRSMKVRSFELYKFNPLSLTAGRLRGSSRIVIPGVVCELLQFAATQ